MGRTFYLDDTAGNDNNTGLAKECAIQTLEAANRIVFGPGDKLLLKRGGCWKGMLRPQGDGVRFAPVEVAAYAEGEMPYIDGDGNYAAIMLDGLSHWRINGLKISNHAADRKVRQGISIIGKAQGITCDIEVCNCEIFEVDGENRRAMPVYRSMYWNGAVYVSFPGRSSDENHLHDIIISGNYIHDVRTSGIRINQQEDFINDIHHTHIVVRGNHIERTGSDAIIVANCISPLIEGNRCFYAGALGTLEDTQLIAGVWVCATKDALIQRNEVAYTKMFENDGTAFDTDWGTAGNTVFQYNYTHDNEGGFWLDCMKLNHNIDCEKTILRYNVSMRDGRGIAVYDQGMPVDWYGNLFYFETPAEICCFDDAENFDFKYNVFAFKKGRIRGIQSAKYQNNQEMNEEWEQLIGREDSDEKWLETVLERLCKMVETKGQK